ncbi:hypothetical protein LF41_2137 [Lysobacter dokdonensis DS-58]|uniref:Uncharacterized protein n=1 Tax=Lysobacter dokdonensis DS-58 TaxID=1300345 RepID=A0A0A2WK81_9GAMM|nr:hypothetical protein [Lysobacter dokdonensis]KGQ20183.1 hypothetical protein LF41_2137 [Lysobacter dokdonensis DS-58]
MTDWIDDIERRANRATPGPWRSYIEGRDFWGGSNVITTAGEDIEPLGGTYAEQDFIAHARQDIPRLLDEITRLNYALSWAGAPQPDHWLADIASRVDAVMEGPWHAPPEEGARPSVQAQGTTIHLDGATPRDVDFIAHARDDIPRLIAEIHRLRGALKSSAP